MTTPRPQYPKIRADEMQVGDIVYIRGGVPSMPHFSGAYEILKHKPTRPGKVQIKFRDRFHDTYYGRSNVRKIDLVVGMPIELMERNGVDMNIHA